MMRPWSGFGQVQCRTGRVKTGRDGHLASSDASSDYAFLHAVSSPDIHYRPSLYREDTFSP
jgi:hypothetical protein